MLGMLLGGCFMAPFALVVPATSGFSTASLLKSGASATANYVVKKTTGKGISEHAFNIIIDNTIMQTYFPNDIKQTYFPNDKVHALTTSESKTFQIHKN